MFKSKLFFVAALLLGGCLTMNATSCYCQTEIHAVGHGKIYADGNQCLPDSMFLKGKEAYQTQVSALFYTLAGDMQAVSTDGYLYIFTLPDADEYIPVGIKYDSLEAELSGVTVDTCSWSPEEDVTYATQKIITNEPRTFTTDTASCVVYVIFKIRPEVIQAACDSIDNYVASKTEIISEELRLAIIDGKENIRKNDDDLDNMNAALDATIKKIDEYFSTGLSNVRSKKANATKRMVNGRLTIEANGKNFTAFGARMK